MPLTLMLLWVLPASGAARQDSHHGTKWWKDSPFRQELGLSDDQSGKIEAIFQSTLPRLRELYDASQREEAQLKKVVDANEAENIVSAQIDRTEEARCAFNKTRTLMLYRMRLVLSPEQRAKFRKVHEDWERQRHKTSGDERR
ncbi:MAG: Spy/CpxP family protein refolding chaperone [Acidobacteriota bacterium]|nr:Spy/CpxP family protein refolding chaperone [Acidobacteriota bacterium]